MPSKVAFTSRAWSGRAAARWSQGTVRAGGSMAANASARSAERLQRVTAAPASCNAAAMARAAPAGAEYQGRAAFRGNIVGAQVGEEAGAVGVQAGDAGGAEHQGVDGAGAEGAAVQPVAQSQRGLLVRDRQVGADEAFVRQRAEAGGELVRRGGQEQVLAVDATAP